jgi:UDP-N-acetyl-D-glucosamine dehydrogenase
MPSQGAEQVSHHSHADHVVVDAPDTPPEPAESVTLTSIAQVAGVPSTVPVGRPVVVVQGLGFVGAAMSVACATAVTTSGDPAFMVVGVDLDDQAGRARVGSINSARFPFETTDAELVDALGAARRTGNLLACTDDRAYGLADVVVIDVPLDIDWRSDTPSLRLAGFEAAIRTVGRHVRPGALVLLETTVPPGTTEKVVAPLLADELAARGLAPDSLLLAHSYERVMPGADYLHSITHYWRVFAGQTDAAAEAAEAFLTQIVDVENYPLTRLSSTTASETAKVMENTFRATTIALMEEWSRFAETVGIDLYEVVDAIRMRPTHANIRTPGFGVGGYCLTKDPLFAKLASEVIWHEPVDFPFSTAAVRTNDEAPLRSLARVADLLDGSVRGKRILLAGVSYRQDVGDTRYSPSETFVRAAEEAGATVVPSDPLVDFWEDLDRPVARQLPEAAGFDAVVFAVPHAEYRTLDIVEWLDDARPAVMDGFSVLTTEQRSLVAALGCPITSIGRGTSGPPPGDAEHSRSEDRS